jgi:hypothetical protein
MDISHTSRFHNQRLHSRFFHFILHVGRDFNIGMFGHDQIWLETKQIPNDLLVRNFGIGDYFVGCAIFINRQSYKHLTF